MFREGKYQPALDAYNMAIMFALNDSKESGLGFANRAAVLLQMGDPEGALKDIELAIGHYYPKELLEKLEQRKAKAQELIEQRRLSYGKANGKDVVGKEIDKRMEIRKRMLHIEKPNPLMPAAAEFVQLKFDDVMGRHLVVTKDVSPGKSSWQYFTVQSAVWEWR